MFVIKQTPRLFSQTLEKTCPASSPSLSLSWALSNHNSHVLPRPAHSAASSFAFPCSLHVLSFSISVTLQCVPVACLCTFAYTHTRFPVFLVDTPGSKANSNQSHLQPLPSILEPPLDSEALPERLVPCWVLPFHVRAIGALLLYHVHQSQQPAPSQLPLPVLLKLEMFALWVSCYGRHIKPPESEDSNAECILCCFLLAWLPIAAVLSPNASTHGTVPGKYPAHPLVNSLITFPLDTPNLPSKSHLFIFCACGCVNVLVCALTVLFIDLPSLCSPRLGLSGITIILNFVSLVSSTGSQHWRCWVLYM